MQQRTGFTIHRVANVLGSDVFLADPQARLDAAQAFDIGTDGYLSLRCLIDNGAGGPPSDAPVGFWELYASDDGLGYSKVTLADNDLLRIRPTGNVKVEAFTIVEGVPGSKIKVLYNRSSGGGVDSRVTLTGSVNR